LVKDNEIYIICDRSDGGFIDLSELEDGKYILKMVGENVKKLEVNITCDQFNFPKYEEVLNKALNNASKRMWRYSIK
jgi:hypothetical protein